MRQVPFLSTPMPLFETDLDRVSIDVLAVTRSFEKHTGKCTAKNPYLANIARCSVRSISRVLDELEAAKLIRRSGGRYKRQLSLTEAGWALCGGHSGGGGEADDSQPLPPVTIKEAPAPKPEKPKKPKAEAKRNPTVIEHSARELPDFIPRDLWTEFVGMRHEQHGPFSASIAEGVVKKITRLKGEGYCPVKLLRAATEGCWMTVHEGKDDRMKATKSGGDPRDTFGGMHVRVGRRERH